MARVKVIWSPTAINHFSNWIHYIARDSVQAAQKEREDLLRTILRLEDFPQSGRIVPEFNNPALRELVRKSIRIIYRLQGNEIRILSFHHCKRNLDRQIFL